MATPIPHNFIVAVIAACAGLSPMPALNAQSANRDIIGDFIETARPHQNQRLSQGTVEPTVATTAGVGVTPSVAPPPDPRTGDADYEQAKSLMAAIDSILKDTADLRSDASKLPSQDDFVFPPLWSETREARNEKVRALLDSALSIVTDVPVVEVQKKVDELRKSIRAIEDQNAGLKEKQISAPQDAMLPGVLNDTVQSIQTAIENNTKLIESKRDEIKAAKAEISSALRASGVELQADQIDLLLDSVLSGDLVRLVAVFNAAKIIDAQLGRMIGATGENMNAARKYFAMHAALFAMLVQAQDATIEKIDTQYMPKLDAIISDIKVARSKTTELMKAENRPDQKRALDANRESQKLADDAAKAYRRYIQQQRQQIATARSKATHDLRIADNTFETVEASVQLRNLMRESTSSFEAIQKLEAPSFEQIFKNDELRREFENLTRKLDAPSS
ncbi:MAG: hypothetical protein CTY31_03380 [Hyphomicrobium sp.]|nr:MAG: hypothetical protein CTY39_02825 [Hyphomicrobium sp.]PPD01791.1 MAG: hypothetical protein CTY31_03380 [Hyphomicrobium sp.]